MGTVAGILDFWSIIVKILNNINKLPHNERMVGKMARPINTKPVVLKGREAKKVYKKTQRVNRSPHYRRKMEEYVAFYNRVEEKSIRRD